MNEIALPRCRPIATEIVFLFYFIYFSLYHYICCHCYQ